MITGRIPDGCHRERIENAWSNSDRDHDRALIEALIAVYEQLDELPARFVAALEKRESV